MESRLARRLAGDPRLVAIGHYSLVPVALIVVTMRAVLQISGSYLICYVVSAPLILLLPALGSHLGGICPRGSCATMTIADPKVLAARHTRALRHVHRPWRSPWLWAAGAAWFILTFVTAWPMASAIPVVAALTVEVRVMRLHSRLRPWCPGCGHGGGLKLHAGAGR